MSKDGGTSELIRLDAKPYSAGALRVFEFLKRHIKGQDDTIFDILDAIEIMDAGFRSPDKTIGTFLFLGGSGVGKTLFAQILALYYFGSREAFTYVPCELYRASHYLSQLIGSPPGYVGHGNPCILGQNNLEKHAIKAAEDKNPALSPLKKAEVTLKQLEAGFWRMNNRRHLTNPDEMSLGEAKLIDEVVPNMMRQRDSLLNKIHALRQASSEVKFDGPSSILLFDEIEKAHPDVFTSILGAIDNAKIPLANGDITKLNRCIMFLTSNVGSDDIAKISKRGMGFNIGSGRNPARRIYRVAMEAAERLFPPEALGRLSGIRVFQPLSLETLCEIFDVEILKFEESYFAQSFIRLKLSEDLKNLIVNEATDRPQNGARLLKHKISKYLERYLARLKNRGELKDGDRIHVLLGPPEDDGKPSIEFYREVAPPEK